MGAGPELHRPDLETSTPRLAGDLIPGRRRARWEFSHTEAKLKPMGRYNVQFCNKARAAILFPFPPVLPLKQRYGARERTRTATPYGTGF